MSRRAGPLLKDVIPPWTYGPMTRSKKYMARVLAARKQAGAQTSVSLDPANPAAFPRSCLPPNAAAVVRPVRSGKDVPKKQRGEPGVALPIPRAGTERHTSWVNQQGRCYYCQHPTPLERWTMDHKTPKAHGGKNHFTNKVGACWTCNHAKRTLSADVFLATEYVRRRREAAP